MKRGQWLPYFGAAVLGAAFAYVAAYFWAYYVVENPINDYLLETLAKQGRRTEFLLATYAHDSVVNFLIAVPFAIGMANLPPGNKWGYLGIAVSSAFALAYGNALINIHFWQILFSSDHAWAGLLVFLLSLPAAYLVATLLRRRVSAA